jgi:hypothetical protein
MPDTYNPADVTLVFAGKTISKGTTEGTFIKFTRNAPTRTLRVGADGQSTIVVNNNRSVVGELTLRAGSETNDTLRNFQMEEDGTTPAYKVGMLSCEYIGGGPIIADPDAFIEGPPSEVSYGVDESSLVWRFILPLPTYDVHGTLAPARIGAGNA